jgi:hypothetical protein
LPPADHLPYNEVGNHTHKIFSGGISTVGPTLQIIDPQGIWLADLFGLLLALPTTLFLAFWMSAVKRPMVVVIGAFAGCFLGFLIILGWVGTLIFDTTLPGATTGAVFFGSVLFNSALGLLFAIFADLIVARLTARDYRRPAVEGE